MPSRSANDLTAHVRDRAHAWIFWSISSTRPMVRSSAKTRTSAAGNASWTLEAAASSVAPFVMTSSTMVIRFARTSAPSTAIVSKCRENVRSLAAGGEGRLGHGNGAGEAGQDFLPELPGNELRADALRRPEGARVSDGRAAWSGHQHDIGPRNGSMPPSSRSFCMLRSRMSPRAVLIASRTRRDFPRDLGLSARRVDEEGCEREARKQAPHGSAPGSRRGRPPDCHARGPGLRSGSSRPASAAPGPSSATP